MSLPSSLVEARRELLGRFAVYAPREAGATTIWRGFLAAPWSPDTDLLLAVPRPNNDAVFRLLVADAGPRIVVEADPLVALRPAHRGVTLADVLALVTSTGGNGRPPLELLALVDRALSRPGLRVQRVTSPSQIVISWDGDVLVDGLDPIAVATSWIVDREGATAAARFDDAGAERAWIEACLLAAVARGAPDFAGARALVDEVAARSVVAHRALSVVERVVLGRFARRGGAHALDQLVDTGEARRVVAALVRELFPERFRADALLAEELATLPPDVLDQWRHVPVAAAARVPPRGERAFVHALRSEAVAEQALVALETAAVLEDSRRALVQLARSRAPAVRAPSVWLRLARWWADAWARLRHRIASARVPRVLPTCARAAPAPRHRRRPPRRRARGPRRVLPPHDRPPEP